MQRSHSGMRVADEIGAEVKLTHQFRGYVLGHGGVARLAFRCRWCLHGWKCYYKSDKLSTIESTRLPLGEIFDERNESLSVGLRHDGLGPVVHVPGRRTHRHAPLSRVWGAD